MDAGKPYWTVSIQYELLDKTEREIVQMDENQKLLYERLKEWRKQKSEKLGIPSYIIATNVQLAEMVRKKCQTIDQLKSIAGFGKARIEKHGSDVIVLIRNLVVS